MKTIFVKTHFLILTVVFLFIKIGNTYSQSDYADDYQRFTISANFAVQLAEYGELNNKLAEKGFSKFNQINFLTSGDFCIYYPKPKLSVHANVSGYSQVINQQNNISTSLKNTGIGVLLGYTFFSDKKIQLVPQIGTQFSWLNLDITSDIAENSTFTNYFSGDANQYGMTASNLLANVGILAKTSFLINENFSNKLVVGIKTGYSMPVLKTIWTVNEKTLNDGPTINPGGFYAGVVVGVEF